MRTHRALTRLSPDHDPPPPTFLRAPERCPEHGVPIARRGASRLEPPPTEPGSPHLLRAAPRSPLRLQYQPRSGGTLPLGPPVGLGPCDPGRGAPKTSDPTRAAATLGKSHNLDCAASGRWAQWAGKGGAAEEKAGEAGGAGGACSSRAQAPPPGSPPTAVPAGSTPTATQRRPSSRCRQDPTLSPPTRTQIQTRTPTRTRTVTHTRTQTRTQT